MKITVVMILVGFIVFSYSQNESVATGNSVGQEYDFQNPVLDLDLRLSDLMNRLTIQEKISQLVYNSPAIPRLGIPEYNWWNEALHGVARAGEATVFPQAIGLAATWNTDKILKMAGVISTEARAKHHEFVRRGEREIYQGLTFWSPNINIFRDPRWGRGQETYGEDPYLTSRLGVAFVKGLQGDDPRYLKTAACAKHFAVHSGPEHLRHEFDVSVSPRDLRETYLAAFETLIKEAEVEAVMCAYNRYQGQACCGSNFLLTEILRREWGFKGHVVSDCWAIADIFHFHKLVDSPEAAAALALKSGTDLNCGEMYQYLGQAYEKGLISEEDINRALRRLLTTRFKLGMFDPPEIVAYAQIPYEKNNAAEHQQLALDLARESLVLLKNENRTLPLAKNLKKIAVLGPNADNFEVLLGNYNGTPLEYSTPLSGIRKIVSTHTEVTYAPATGYTGESLILKTIPASLLYHDGQKGLQAEYFSNMNLEGKPFLTRIDEQLDWNWLQGNPVPGLPTMQISARWKGEITPLVSGEYILGVTGDDGFRFYLDGKLVFNAWQDQGATTKTTRVLMEAGKSYAVQIEYYQNGGEALIQLAWQEPGVDMHRETMQAVKDADAIIFVGGISPRLEGEEMGEQVQYEGFYRGDRTKISLPDIQTRMLKELHTLGKPVILVVMSGSAVAINWENENLPAILQAWYPGQAGGQAVADVLFGNYNPAGRLPVTVYKSENDLPEYTDYDMEGRTYRYFRGEPLYPFGYGLSYTKFDYLSASTDKSEYTTNETINLKITLKNIGLREGDEVVQVYVSNENAGNAGAIKELKGFRRLHLNKDQESELTISIPTKILRSYDQELGELIVKPGNYELQVGASAGDIRQSLRIKIN